MRCSRVQVIVQVKKTSDKRWVIQSTRSIGVERHQVEAAEHRAQQHVDEHRDK